MIGLTGADERALVAFFKTTAEPLKRIVIGRASPNSHFRFFRLLHHGMVAIQPPRLTDAGLRRALAVLKADS